MTIKIEKDNAGTATRRNVGLLIAKKSEVHDRRHCRILEHWHNCSLHVLYIAGATSQSPVA